MTTRPPRPNARPANPRFSSGPCSKRPGWSFESLGDAMLGRSHRSAQGREKLERAIALTREVLQVPHDYRIGIVPASDTGAVEMALWSLLGARKVDVAVFDVFSRIWAHDIASELNLPNTRVFEAKDGFLPDLTQIDFDRDFVFAWNGTTAGLRVPNADFISKDHKGLTICDATSAAFAQRLDFSKLDVTTYSWQKILGGEAAHGMLILSPRAVERLESFTPPRPIPKIFRLTRNGKLLESIFRGETINTPSLLCVEDYLDALDWAKSIGGLEALIARADNNAAALERWIDAGSAFDYVARIPETRSNTSVCLRFADPKIAALPNAAQAHLAYEIVERVEREGAGYDFNAHREAHPGLRIWCGATVETADIELLAPWIDWAYAESAAAL